jgi:hypothetical protein
LLVPMVLIGLSAVLLLRPLFAKGA